jgi:lipopolysaccharide export LptBFGC system permease protein LptF
MRGSIIGRYIVRQTVPWLLIGLFGVSFLFLSTQLIRITPVFAGVPLDFSTVSEVVFLLLIPVVGWALSPAFLIALFAVAGSMSANGELDGMDALSIPRSTRLGVTLGFIAALSLPCAWIWLDSAPRAQQRLFVIATALAEESLMGRMVAQQVSEPFPGLTFYAEQMGEGHCYNTVFVEWNGGRGSIHQVVAERAVISRRPSGGALSIVFEKGDLFIISPGNESVAGGPVLPNTAISFDRFNISVPVDAAAAGRIDFFPMHLSFSTKRLMGAPPPDMDIRTWRYTLWRRIAGPIGFLVLSICGVFLAFGTSWRSRGRAALAATLLFLVYHLSGRGGETLMAAGIVPPEIAAMLPCPTVIVWGLVQGGGIRFAERMKQRLHSDC